VEGILTCFGSKLSQWFENKSRGLLSRGFCVQGDNSRIYAARHAVKQIQDLKLGLRGAILSALFMRFNFQQLSFLLPIEDTILGCRLRWDDKVRKAVYHWLAQQSQGFNSRGIYNLGERWRGVCVESVGDYTKNDYHL
jgi:hypothetical protein